MSQRMEALWRIAAFLYGLLASFVTSIVTFVGIIWMIVDLAWQLLSGRNDLSENSYPARLVSGTLRWNVDLLVFSLTGDGEMQWLPDV